MSVHSSQGPQASTGQVPSAQERLDSWKEIAAYLRRDERTVRRWEKAQGLPVHRHPHSKQSSVYAYRAELDAWWNNGHERLAAMTATAEPAAAAPRQSRTWLWVAGLVAVVAVAGAAWLGSRPARGAGSLVTAAQRGVVVLPFRNVTGNADLDYFGMAVGELIAERLSFVSTRTVGPQLLVKRFGNEGADLAAVAQGSSAGLLVTGSYQQDNGRLRITLQIQMQPDLGVVWEQHVDTNLAGTVAIGDLVADQIWPGMKQPEGAAGPTSDKVAYENLLRGIDAAAHDNLPLAIQHYEAALKLQPDLAAARARLAFAYLVHAYGIAADAEKEEAGARLVRDLLKSGGASPAVLSEAGLLLMELGRLEEATAALQHAVSRNPRHGDAHFWLSQAYRYGGALGESQRELEIALRLNPELREESTANVYLYQGKYEEFLRNMPQRVVTARTTFYRGLAHLYQSQKAEAESEFAKASRIEPGQLHARYGEVFGLATKGQREEGLRVLRELARNPLPDGEMQYKIAQGFALLGDTPSALRFLRQAAEAGFICHSCFVRDPLLRSLQGQPEFEALLRVAREKQEAFRKSFLP